MSAAVHEKRRIAAQLFWMIAAIAVGVLLVGVLDIYDLPDRRRADGWRNYWMGLGIGMVAAVCAWAYLLTRPVEQSGANKAFATRVVQLIPLLGGIGIFLSQVTDETPFGVGLAAGLGAWLLVSLVGLRLDWKRRRIFAETPSSTTGATDG